MINRPAPSPKKASATGANAVMGRVKVSYPRVRRILVPLDFSGKSRQALRYATPIAEKFSSKVILLHVLQPAHDVASGPVNHAVPRDRTKEALRRLENMAATYLPKTLRGPRLVRVGSPYGEILAVAQKLDVDLIALTTRGRTGLKRFFVGSTAEQVMRHAPCPVLSVRKQ
ncbi:MAG: universal stress protein [Verrucomicrobia bacterium]|nr:universal stress protein [Verrucomicrobiota bacterium]